MNRRTAPASHVITPCLIEELESRRLLSAGHHVAHAAHHAHATHASVAKHLRHATATKASSSGSQSSEQEVQLSAAPAAVQTGLQALAPVGFTIPQTQEVEVHTNSAGVTTYSTEIHTAGVEAHLIVDGTGAPVTPTGGEHDGGEVGDHAGDHKNQVQFSTIPAIVQTALQGQAPTGVTIAQTQSVCTYTNAAGVLVYVVHLEANGTETAIAADATGAVVTLPADGEKPGGHND